jgi:hypothetical protein
MKSANFTDNPLMLSTVLFIYIVDYRAGNGKCQTTGLLPPASLPSPMSPSMSARYVSSYQLIFLVPH